MPGSSARLAVLALVLAAPSIGAEPLSAPYDAASAKATFAKSRFQLHAAAEGLADGGDAGVLRARLAALAPLLAPEAQQVAGQTDAFLADVEKKKELAKDDSLAPAVSEELDSLSQTKDADEMSRRAADELRVRSEEVFPEDIPLEQWNKLDAIRRFLVKHRWSKPRSYARVTLDDLEAGRVNVQKGVEVEGVVVDTDVSHIDFDYNFRLGRVVMEITPEWRLFHWRLHKPKIGERVRVRGWTYYDGFHKVEDFLHKRLGTKKPAPGVEEDGERESLWEIHPVQEVQVIGEQAPPKENALDPRR